MAMLRSRRRIKRECVAAAERFSRGSEAVVVCGDFYCAAIMGEDGLWRDKYGKVLPPVTRIICTSRSLISIAGPEAAWCCSET